MAYVYILSTGIPYVQFSVQRMIKEAISNYSLPSIDNWASKTYKNREEEETTIDWEIEDKGRTNKGING